MAPMTRPVFALLGTLAMVALGLVALAGHNHLRVALLQDGGKQDGGKLNAFLLHAESEMTQLRREAPGAGAAHAFPKEAKDLSGLLSQSRSELAKVQQQLAKAEVKAEQKSVKKARRISLAQESAKEAKRSQMTSYLDQAGKMMSNLERQLPAKDARRFPKEASELKTVFGTEMRKLGGIEEQIMHEAATQTPGSAKKAKRSQLATSRLPQAQQSALDKSVQQDNVENHSIAGKKDMDAFFRSIEDTEAPKAKSQQQVAGSAKRARVQQLQGTLKQSGTQVWGEVYNPAMANSARGQAGMTPQGQQEFNSYAQTAADVNNVHDPTKDGHRAAADDWLNTRTGKASHGSGQWWQHQGHKGFFN